MMNFALKTKSSVINEELCMKNEECCIINDGLWRPTLGRGELWADEVSKNDELELKTRNFVSKRGVVYSKREIVYSKLINFAVVGLGWVH